MKKQPCPKCGGANTKKHTPTSAGTPRVFCYDCGKASVTTGKNKPGPAPKGGKPMTSTERYQKWWNGLTPDRQEEIKARKVQRRRDQRFKARLAAELRETINTLKGSDGQTNAEIAEALGTDLEKDYSYEDLIALGETDLAERLYPDGGEEE